MHILGIDEAGRAPLAGPVAVGFVRIPDGFDVLAHFPGAKDSKLLTEKKREEIFRALEERAEALGIRWCVRFGTHETIDARGITIAVKQAIRSGVKALAPEPDGVRVQLDGALYAPREYEQETVIRGDALVPVISLASIVAKVSRDRLMKKYARKFPHYGFELHKGYGTRFHYDALRAHGPCEIHRATYLHLAEPV